MSDETDESSDESSELDDCARLISWFIRALFIYLILFG